MRNFIITTIFLLFAGSLASSVPVPEKIKKEIRVPIRAMDLKGNHFTDIEDCAVHRAVARKLGFKKFFVAPGHLTWYEGYESHVINIKGSYGPIEFDWDHMKAWFNGFDTTIVDVVTLTP
ncbi:MAG TPA: hypothetical protein VK628_02885 [Flavitalea sp.]|nr:hypothetical protein [Flavitalea sp.]